ncbi:MAG: UDP-N-acetylmuramoyl-L-alanyl-D-glutamate--2,6-diaminopimelate ligase [Acidimicrobiales bacterium]
MTTSLDRLLSRIEVAHRLGEAKGLEVTSVTHDSRAVAPGALFCSIRGEHADGHDFAVAAVEAGAVAVLAERETPATVPHVIVGDTRLAIGPVAAAFHDDPARSLDVVGVTGTGGKTTTIHLLGSILDAAGRPAGLIGTLTGARTTPEAPELQARLAGFRDEGKRAVAMEVSSHALAMHRVDGTRFELAVFTNLSRDHLDFHRSMEDYFAAKARLFTPELAARGLANLDDAHGRLLADAAVIPTVGYSMADAGDVRVGARESRLRWHGVEVRVPLGGRLNVSNAIAAATAARLLGVAPDTVAAGIDAAGPVPGRFELVEAGQPFPVIVDYSHKPDGLAQVLASAREVAAPTGRVLVVFGCGGDRDRSKRPKMGAVADELADLVVVTSDNPRSEDPAGIIDEIVAGVPDRSDRFAAGRLVVEPDRQGAISLAVARAGAGDVVVIAGKGHETTQTLGDRVVPFDDREAARRALGLLDGSPA